MDWRKIKKGRNNLLVNIATQSISGGVNGAIGLAYVSV